MHTSIRIIPIASLPACGDKGEVAFFIPAYQRGYRWKKVDVTKLLCDLMEFIEDQPNGRPFYCLQPLVTKKSKDSEGKECWEVVDGQQRLTTLYLIWKFLNGHPHYELSYETRERSKEFLSEISGKNHSDINNIDFHHIYHAYQAIKGWFQEDVLLMAQFRSLFNDQTADGRNIRFIWYQLQEDDDVVAAFTRLNVGKIPLRDEELIRALFLSSNRDGQLADRAFQHRLALEWDRIETALQEPDFWGFLSNETAPEGGRIRMLFQLCAPKDIIGNNHELFEHYQSMIPIEQPDKAASVWREIVACFEQLDEWHDDPEFFHLVGYLNTILEGKSLDSLRGLLNESKQSNKSGFAEKLRFKIRQKLIKGRANLSDFIDELDYLQNSDLIRPTLALFNIASLLRSDGVSMRFPFHLYHANRWDIEHVHSQGGQNLSKKSDRNKWLNSFLDEIQRRDEKNELMPIIKAFLENKPDALNFELVYKKVGELFNEVGDANELHGIGNLTLLDQSTNRRYGNDPFVIKREKILNAERHGTFILPCTRDLFLKVFSENAGNLRQWDIAKDGDAHKDAICQTLAKFFGETEGSPA
jgi:hypothetical protein